MGLAVFDVDGVVADVRHRLHHLEGDGHRRHGWYQDWDAFFSAAGQDPVLSEGVGLVRQYASDGHDIAWLTGRPAWLRRVTLDWLEAAGLPTDELIMRGSGDYRPARLFKVEQLRRLAREREVLLFVDDDPDVVATAVAAGFTTLHATWVPHSKTLKNAQEVSGRT